MNILSCSFRCIFVPICFIVSRFNTFSRRSSDGMGIHRTQMTLAGRASKHYGRPLADDLACR